MTGRSKDDESGGGRSTVAGPRQAVGRRASGLATVRTEQPWNGVHQALVAGLAGLERKEQAQGAKKPRGGANDAGRRRRGDGSRVGPVSHVCAFDCGQFLRASRRMTLDLCGSTADTWGALLGLNVDTEAVEAVPEHGQCGRHGASSGQPNGPSPSIYARAARKKEVAKRADTGEGTHASIAQTIPEAGQPLLASCIVAAVTTTLRAPRVRLHCAVVVDHRVGYVQDESTQPVSGRTSAAASVARHGMIDGDAEGKERAMAESIGRALDAVQHTSASGNPPRVSQGETTLVLTGLRRRIDMAQRALQWHKLYQQTKGSARAPGRDNAMETRVTTSIVVTLHIDATYRAGRNDLVDVLLHEVSMLCFRYGVTLFVYETPSQWEDFIYSYLDGCLGLRGAGDHAAAGLSTASQGDAQEGPQLFLATLVRKYASSRGKTSRLPKKAATNLAAAFGSVAKTLKCDKVCLEHGPRCGHGECGAPCRACHAAPV